MLVAALFLTLTAATPAVADQGPTGDAGLCRNRYICVVVTEPGSTAEPGGGGGGSSGGSAGGVQMCSWNGLQWPCWDDDLGWFSTADGCYYHRSEPQPPASDPAWDGHAPSDGAVYEVNCRGVGGQLSPKPPMFFAQPPGGAPPPDRPYDLGMKALGMIHFDSPALHAAPAATAVVGVPVWLWYTPGPTTAGPQSATAKGRTMSVTATARLTKVHWDAGDGSAGADCTGPGTAYTAGAGTEPPCGHTYRKASGGQQDQTFYLTATLTWRVEAVRSDTGARVFAVDYRVTTDQPLPLKVAEVQALN
ncbi:hypothetical protein [Streptomyces sp. NRRL B-24484]|uniref:hypothetical protein n=1 Tax=Streptomyces sp. NRRL B-24484 TaxID=1463833 RepID=UPI0006937128|nr:hypothetical protein [Streptomyces sp. NRRL B-24484]